MKRIFLISFSIMLLIVLLGVAEASDLFGKIWLHGKPLTGAKIELILENESIASTKTNEFGYYSFRKLDTGTYQLKIHLPDNTTRNEEVYVFPQNTEKNFKIE